MAVASLVRGDGHSLMYVGCMDKDRALVSLGARGRVVIACAYALVSGALNAQETAVDELTHRAVHGAETDTTVVDAVGQVIPARPASMTDEMLPAEGTNLLAEISALRRIAHNQFEVQVLTLGFLGWLCFSRNIRV